MLIVRKEIVLPLSGRGKPEHANQLYEYIIEQTRQSVSNVQTGIFGADMKVSLVNDGPFTIMLDSEELFLEKILGDEETMKHKKSKIIRGFP